jgi:arylsulfatase A-like enzyme
MTRRTLLRSAFGGAAAASLAGAQTAKRPNFIIIYTDDQGIGDLGCYGAKEARTPNLDKLAAAGARFTSWYSNCPVCSPSRASLLTGKYPQRTGIVDVLPSDAGFNVPGLREGETSLARSLRDAGYHTACVGKWHLGSAAHSRPRPQGFDQFFGFFSGWTDYYSHRYYRMGAGPQQIFHDLWNGDTETAEEPEYQTSIFSRKAVEFVSQQTAASPFFLYVAFGAPHYPMIATKKHLERFPADMDRDRRTHLAVIAAVDDAVGEIVAALKSRGLDRDTVIFFQSDNGATEETRADSGGRPYRGGSNAPYRGYKTGLFEGGIRMPALMSWPSRIPAGQVINESGIAMDVLPTFLEWAGVAAPAGIDGRSVASVVTKRGKSPHGDLFWSYKKQLAVRRGKWKLLLNGPRHAGTPDPDPVWLTDLESDPGESRNRAESEPAVVTELRNALEAWKAQTGQKSAAD